MAGAVISGPMAAAAASPRDGGCTDCARDLIALAHDLALNALLARLGGQFAIAAGVIAVAWLAVSMVRARRRRTPLSFDRCGRCGGRGVRRGRRRWCGGDCCAAVLPTRWPTAGARRPTARFFVLAAAVAVPALRAARARRVVARAAVAVADDPAGGAVDALAAALDDPGLSVAYPAPRWRPGATTVASRSSCPSGT